MTTIEKDYACKFHQDDVLTVEVYPDDEDAVFSIGGEDVVLNTKQIRKLIKQLKKALPEKVSKSEEKGFSREDVHGNIHVGDTVVIHLPGAGVASDRAEGTVVEVDEDDRLMPLRVALVGGVRSWIWFDEETRVFKLK